MHQQENSEQFFEKYIGGCDQRENTDYNIIVGELPHYQLHKEELQLRISRINMKLQGIIAEKLSNNFSYESKDLEQILKIIELLIGNYNREHDSRLQIMNEMRQLQNINFNNVNTIDKLTKQKNHLQAEKASLLQNSKHNEKKLKQSLEKSNQQKQEIIKQLRQIQSREKTIEAQFRKKQNVIKQFQQQIKKLQQDKPNYRNNFEVLHKFENGNNLLHFSTNPDNQYGQMASQSVQFTLKKLTTENKHLKECLSNIYRELNSVLDLKKQMLRNRRGYEEYQELFEVKMMSSDTFNLPENLSRERLLELNQNIQKFKEAMKIGDLADHRIENQKQTCVGGIKQIIKNYKQIVDSQDQLLNKVVLKSKQFKAAEIAHLENRYARINEANEIDRAKKFVEEQAQYLQSKNQQLQKTRKMMQMAMKKAEQNKRQMIRQKQNLESEALEIRRSLQILPIMVEQELSKVIH